MPHDAPEIETVSTARVACDGREGALGHPRVYLAIDPEIGFVQCPYCDKRFVMPGDTSHHLAS